MDKPPSAWPRDIALLEFEFHRLKNTMNLTSCFSRTGLRGFFLQMLAPSYGVLMLKNSTYCIESDMNFVTNHSNGNPYLRTRGKMDQHRQLLTSSSLQFLMMNVAMTLPSIVLFTRI